jgi:methyltransferase-like protein
VTEDTRDNNITATFAFKAYKDVTLGYPFKFDVKTKQSVLP